MTISAFTLFKLVGLGEFSFFNTMRTELADCRTCLDVGCGWKSPVWLFGFEYSVGVEGHAPALEEAKHRKTHNDFRVADVTALEKHFSARQFDCCIALDLIEHLTKEDGLKLLRDMERIASKKVLIVTPNGFLHQHGYDGNSLQEHLSGWTYEEMQSLGYKVYGMLGPKYLRGEYHRLRLKPTRLWGMIAAGAHFLYTKRKAKHAAAILCVKNTSR